MTNDNEYRPLHQVYPASGPYTWVYSENFTRSPAETNPSITASNQLSNFPFNVQQHNYIEAHQISSRVEAVSNPLCDGMGTRRFRESDGQARIMPTNLSIAVSIHKANSSGVGTSSRKMIRVEEQPQNK